MPAPQYVDKKGRIIETLPFYIRLLLLIYSLQSCLAEVLDDSICYRLCERKHLGIALQREFGIYPEDLCGCGPGLFLPP
jgi:hypothetical protein